MGMVLDTDMLTITEGPVFVAPGCEYSEGTGFEGHEYFEAASIRKKGDLYLFIYSSIVMHELCYAWSRSPLSGFQYGGVLNSNAISEPILINRQIFRRPMGQTIMAVL